MDYIKDLDFVTYLSEVESQIEGGYQVYNYRPSHQKVPFSLTTVAKNGSIATTNFYITNVYYLGNYGGHGGYGSHGGYGRKGDDDDYDDDDD